MIVAGDLVVVDKPMPCCGATDGMGWIFTVAGLRLQKNVTCIACGGDYGSDVVAHEHGRIIPVRVSRLRRIPPPSELQMQGREAIAA